MRKTDFIKRFAKFLATSFFFLSIFILLYFFIFNDKATYMASIINTTAIEKSKKEKDAIYSQEAKKLIGYPTYGKKYANLKIDKINLNLPIYYGDSLEILRYGVGHYAGSYFPGEGGSIIMPAHNTVGFFNRLEELNKEDLIIIETNYGVFKYKVDSYKVVKETDLKAFPIQDKREMLILYTCYPINKNVVGRRTERYVVYSYRVEDTYE